MKKKNDVHLIVATLKISSVVMELEKMGVSKETLQAALARSLLFSFELDGNALVQASKGQIDEAMADPDVLSAISIVESKKAMAN